MFRKKSALILIIIVIGLGIGGWYVYTKYLNPPHRDIKEEVGIKVDAEKIFQDYTTDEKKADSIYLDKAVEVTGKIIEIGKNPENKTVVYLQTSDPIFGVKCTMEGDISLIKKGDDVKLKGICTGFNSDVVLIRCYLAK